MEVANEFSNSSNEHSKDTELVNILEAAAVDGVTLDQIPDRLCLICYKPIRAGEYMFLQDIHAACGEEMTA